VISPTASLSAIAKELHAKFINICKKMLHHRLYLHSINIQPKSRLPNPVTSPAIIEDTISVPSYKCPHPKITVTIKPARMNPHFAYLKSCPNRNPRKKSSSKKAPITTILNNFIREIESSQVPQMREYRSIGETLNRANFTPVKNPLSNPIVWKSFWHDPFRLTI
jgi:hypothetical protein